MRRGGRRWRWRRSEGAARHPSTDKPVKSKGIVAHPLSPLGPGLSLGLEAPRQARQEGEERRREREAEAELARAREEGQRRQRREALAEAVRQGWQEETERWEAAQREAEERRAAEETRRAREAAGPPPPSIHILCIRVVTAIALFLPFHMPTEAQLRELQAREDITDGLLEKARKSLSGSLVECRGAPLCGTNESVPDAKCWPGHS